MIKFLTDAQLAAEIKKCEYCEDKPCKTACPADCSPANFIMAAKQGETFDYKRAASMILANNPLGGVCGAVCPDSHCQKACVHCTFDSAVDIPAVQATIIQKAKEMGMMPVFHLAKPKNQSIAIIGGGPAGLAAASVLVQEGYSVTIFEKKDQLGGMCHLIPDVRLPKEVLHTDIAFLQGLGDVQVKCFSPVVDPKALLDEGYQTVIICTGLDQSLVLKVPGAELGMTWDKYLEEHHHLPVKDQHVAVIGGGAVAADCAVTAKIEGAVRVDMICLESNADMPLTSHERKSLLEHDIVIIPKTTVTKITADRDRLSLDTAQINFPKNGRFDPAMIIPQTDGVLKGYHKLIFAIGAKSSVEKYRHKKIFFAGDMQNGPTTVVEAIASGKNAALKVDAVLQGKTIDIVEKDTKSTKILNGKITMPISLEADFFGRKIFSPFLLSASPMTDGYDQMKKAYEAGWAGGIMKTAFDNVPIHIPSEYMFVYDDSTYANCDNVSGHHLDRVCLEIQRLIKEYPDRLTMASTGGPVTGDDEHDKKGWQSNTKKLEQAGAMGVEYSLSCPQGGDGTEGDIVSQNAQLTAKIIGWVMEISDSEIPKLFKLTSAVTSIYPIITAIKEVFAKYPHKKAGITLANSFPTMAFRKGNKSSWDEGIIAGMSGEAVTYISNLALANVSAMGVIVSGNGGPMDYKAAADFLALGVKTVQFCTIATKYGVSIIDELHSGLSYLMQSRGLKSIQELIGCALPHPVTDFMALSPVKKISAVDEELCQHCGNCTRCPYQAITLNEDKVPVTDSSKCIGCSVCVQKCFSKALSMRERTEEELALLSED